MHYRIHTVFFCMRAKFSKCRWLRLDFVVRHVWFGFSKKSKCTNSNCTKQKKITTTGIWTSNLCIHVPAALPLRYEVELPDSALSNIDIWMSISRPEYSYSSIYILGLHALWTVSIVRSGIVVHPRVCIVRPCRGKCPGYAVLPGLPARSAGSP